MSLVIKSDPLYNDEILKKYGRILNEQVKNGKIDPIIGRHKEINDIIRILSRKTKNNPVLIGEPGVGKSAIIEALAQKINENNVPENLKNRIIYELDLGSLVAGSKFHGEFEERLKAVVNKVKKSNGKIIIFIDELHLIVGAGKTQGAMDASNLLKPLLARGELRCIGATTLSEYREYIEKDGALERRYQKVFIEEPTKDETISILRGLKEHYEIYHGIKITDKAIVAAVELSMRYINDRFLPDKAIDLIDEASATIKTQITSMPLSLDELNNRIIKLNIEKIALSKESDNISKNRVLKIEKELSKLNQEQKILNDKWIFEKKNINKLNKLKTEIQKLKDDLKENQTLAKWDEVSKIQYSLLPEKEKELKSLEKNSNHSLLNKEVNEKSIANIISKWTRISLAHLTESESKKIKNLKFELLKNVKGQNHAVNIICNALWRAKNGIQDPNKPIGSFLFLGPTGVGKTKLARSLSYALFGSENKIIQIDMSEYMEKHSISKLIGSPPGYIGYQQGGQLTEKVRRNPYSIILLDEIEKADKNVINVLLQIFDKGVLTDSLGRNVNFKNTIIIMTSNIGSNKNNFYTLTNQLTNLPNPNIVIKNELLKFFSPELLNRIDNIIKFKILSESAIYQIINKELEILFKRIEKNLNIKLKVNKDVMEKIIKNGYDKFYGARTIKKYIQDNVELIIAKSIMNNEIISNNIYSLGVNVNNEFYISKNIKFN